MLKHNKNSNPGTDLASFTDMPVYNTGKNKNADPQEGKEYFFPLLTASLLLGCPQTTPQQMPEQYRL